MGSIGQGARRRERKYKEGGGNGETTGRRWQRKDHRAPGRKGAKEDEQAKVKSQILSQGLLSY